MKFRLKPQIGKWQIGFYITKRVERYWAEQLGWWRCGLYILKLTELPNEGYMFQKKHYKGFWLRFTFWLPFDRY